MIGGRAGERDRSGEQPARWRLSNTEKGFHVAPREEGVIHRPTLTA
jgi:hypothetical protein